MESVTYFESTRGFLLAELAKASSELVVTNLLIADEKFLNVIEQKVEAGISVRVIGVADQADTESMPPAIEALERKGAEIALISGTTGYQRGLLDRTVALVDRRKIFCGVYDSGDIGKTFTKVITEIADDREFVSTYCSELEQLLARHGYHGSGEVVLDHGVISKRLSAIKTLLELDDDSWHLQLQKLEPYQSDEGVDKIIETLQAGEHEAGIELIGNYVSRKSALEVWNDPEKDSQAFYMQLLEIQLDSLNNEKSEVERLVGEFEYQKVMTLGPLIKEYLELRRTSYQEQAKEKPEFEQEYQEAHEEYEEFTESYEEVQKEERKSILSDEEKAEFKNLFRKAKQLCHPDKFPEESKEEANAMFLRIGEAYQSNNIELLKSLLEQIQAGDLSQKISAVETDSKKIRVKINRFRQDLADLLKEIEDLINTDTWEIIGEYDDYKPYFDKQTIALEAAIQKLKEEPVSE